MSRKLEVPVPANKASVNVSPDFNFAMAIALFGQLLRDSDFTGNAKYSDVINLARKGLDNDPNGYHAGVYPAGRSCGAVGEIIRKFGLRG